MPYDRRPETVAEWRAREANRTSTRFEREQALAKARGFRTAHEMRKANHQAKRQRYVPAADAEPATPLLDRLEGGSGPVRWIMRDGVLLNRGGEQVTVVTVRNDSQDPSHLTPQDIVVSPPKFPEYSLATKQVHQYQQTRGRK